MPIIGPFGQGGGSGGGGGLTASGLATMVGEGNALIVVDGEITGLPAEVAQEATCWDYLTNTMAGLADQGAAVKRWEQEYEDPVSTAAYDFVWPTDVDGQRDRTGCRQITATGNLVIDVLEPGAAIGAVDQFLALKFRITGSGGTRTISFLGSVMPVVWASGVPAKQVAADEVVTIHVLFEDGVGTATFVIPE